MDDGLDIKLQSCIDLHNYYCVPNEVKGNKLGKTRAKINIAVISTHYICNVWVNSNM